MKFSNMYQIKSKSVIDALSADGYDLSERPANVFSATQIIDAPKCKELFRRHAEEIVTDVSDNFHMLDGSAVHYAVEMSNKDSEAERLSEERIFIQIPFNLDLPWSAHTLPHGGKIVEQPWYSASDYYVSVKFDNFEVSEGIVEDYKRTSAWEAVFGLKEARVQQLNIATIALSLLGFEVKGLRACLFLKDWSSKNLKSAETSGSYYPAIPYREFDIPVWDISKARGYIANRLSLHVLAQTMFDDDIPECTKDERWYRGESYAVMKGTNVKATKVFKVEDEVTSEQAKASADGFAASLQEKDSKVAYTVVTRPGQDTRCFGDKTYCSTRQFCHYWKTNYADKTVGQDSEY